MNVTELSADDEALVSLIALCAIRDQQALKKLYDRTAPFLNGVAYRLLNSQELSNEVLQDAFVQIWQNASVYRVDKAKPMTWLTSIVRYRALDKLQSEKRHHQKRDDNEDAVNELADAQTPEQDYDQLQTLVNTGVLDVAAVELSINGASSITDSVTGEVINITDGVLPVDLWAGQLRAFTVN